MVFKVAAFGLDASVKMS